MKAMVKLVLILVLGGDTLGAFVRVFCPFDGGEVLILVLGGDTLGEKN